MNIDSLRTFLVLVQTMNYRKAAQQLFLAQSTVSARIQELEKELGEDLFEHNGRTLKLTQAGQKLIPYSEEMIQLEENLKKNVCSAEKSCNTLRLGISDSILYWRIQNIIPGFLSKYKDYSMQLYCNNSGVMMNWLQDDKLDICISFMSNKEKGYQSVLFSEEKLLLATRMEQYAHTPLSRQKLLNKPLLITDYFNITNELANWFHSIFPQNHRFKLRTNTIFDMVYYLKNMDVFAFVPEGYIKEELTEKQLFQIPIAFKEPPLLRSYAVVKCSSFESSPVKEFLHELKELFSLNFQTKS